VSAVSLPSGFEALEVFVSDWSFATAAERAQRRLDSTAQEREVFFHTAENLVAPALDLLDAKPLDQHDAQEQRLMSLLLSLAHIGLALEIQGDEEPRHARDARHITITRAVSDS